MPFKIGPNRPDKMMVGAGAGASECRLMYDGSTVIYARPFVTFDEVGGTPAATDKYVYYGEVYGTLPTVSKNGYTFTGWSDLVDTILASTIVTRHLDHTLYAQYQYAPAQPTIEFFSATSTSISFYITNNSPYTVTMYYEYGDPTPDLYSVSLGAGATSSLLTINGLPSNTDCDIYAMAYIGGQYSAYDMFVESTLANQTATPTINAPYKTTTWRYTVKNNDASTATIYSDYNGTNPPTTSRGAIASGANTAVINTGYAVTGFTIYARAQASGKDMSNVTSYYV